MKGDKKLIWLDINSSYSHSSLALPAIEACRERDDYEWGRVSATINSELYPIVCELYAKSPDVVASTLWLFNHEVVVKLCQRIKALRPETVIILGGPEFNGDNEEFLRRNNFVDFVFRGEGEVEFHRFLRGEDLDSIVGLCHIDSSGKYCDNGKARVADFANIPSPESSEFFCYSSPFVQLESSRGCFNNCAFCVSGGDKPLRSRSLEDIKLRIDNIRDHNIRDVRMLDRTFNYSPSRARDMLALFAEYPDMNFHLEIHPALLTDSLCEVLSEVPKGVLHIEAGMQSLSDRVIEIRN
ncbi:MAG: radical SAM protein [Rikenellaceae bacterium]